MSKGISLFAPEYDRFLCRFCMFLEHLLFNSCFCDKSLLLFVIVIDWLAICIMCLLLILMILWQISNFILKFDISFYYETDDADPRFFVLSLLSTHTRFWSQPHLNLYLGAYVFFGGKYEEQWIALPFCCDIQFKNLIKSIFILVFNYLI